mmetsp:Transcript_6941/g.8641  ORF Transcript_6941/g.8641 Transcript_6941/m.8641 type:complete len:147 (+) Transcript_6941:98-538(+)|eukprot:CAMPEP_0172503818 /NCGR_PEP_ID=MMETSP1066-20121228/172585_1 /TAXON_ID=671091 /ORGANISM="Coscinodiscus wailesii, Strain CCMP2513" /LENGTH=146 /DNA_ID=CAMNT_0013279711 /DNA_START=98 /DNA_END=538 /DNA_ORIENTATION=-
MPPKKKKGKQKKSQSKVKPAKNEGGEKIFAPSFSPVIGIPSSEEWVKLEMKLMDWEYMDFDITVRTDTYLFAIKKIIEKKHGRITDLKMCRHSFQETNELNDIMRTLKECGVEGGAKENPPTVRICYDFKVADFAAPEPILLSWSC